MRVAFFVYSFPEISESFILRQITGLLDRGHGVGIFSLNPPESKVVHETVDEYDLRRLTRYLSFRDNSGALPPQEGKEGVPINPARWLPGVVRSLRGRYAADAGGWRALVRTLRAVASEQPFDVVHCHYGTVGLRVRVMARFWNVPLVVSFYGYDCSVYPRTWGTNVYTSLFSDVDAVTALSYQMDRRLMELGCAEDQLHRVPLGVHPDVFSFRERRKANTGEPVRLLTVGRLVEKKGIEYAIRAVARLRNRFPNLRYDIIGDGPLRPALETLSASLGVADRIQFQGVGTEMMVRQAMHAADLFVLPSITAEDGDEEGTPTVLLEAASSGLPVLSTLHAGIPEIVLDGESGYLVPERDENALTNRLAELINMSSNWASMGRAGRHHIERNHSSDAIAQRLEVLYGTLCRGPAARE